MFGSVQQFSFNFFFDKCFHCKDVIRIVKTYLGIPGVNGLRLCLGTHIQSRIVNSWRSNLSPLGQGHQWGN